MIIDNKGKKYKVHDREVIKRLAAIMCSYEEIGGIIGMTEEGVKKRFKKVIDAGRAQGKESLRKAQFKRAVEQGDTRMQIWLGKQYLGQSEQPNANDNTQVLQWEEDKE